MDFSEWAEREGIQPSPPTIGEWLRKHPEEVAEIRGAVERGFDWGQAALYVAAQGGPVVSEDTLRKAAGRLG